MGHIRLGDLPRTRRWQEVVGLVAGGASVGDVAAATALAAESGLATAATDPGLVESVWLLTQIPVAARRDDYVERLRECGLPVSDEPSLVELCSAFSKAIDGRLRGLGLRSDLGEMAQLAAVETLSRTVGHRLPALLGAVPSDVRAALSGLATTSQFGVLAREFFSRLIERYLTYFLSKELSNHVGASQRFPNASAHAEFNSALGTHCRETSRIVGAFAGGWFSKTNFEGGISRESAGRFAHVALKKTVSELRKRRGDDEH